MKIKSKRYNNQRWMRCINANDLEDYVDISIGGGSLLELRHSVLELADFLGGTWDNWPESKRVEYDYYYLYRRDVDGTFDVTGNGEYNDIIIGQHRDGDVVWVDMKTNEINSKLTLKEWRAQGNRGKNMNNE